MHYAEFSVFLVHFHHVRIFCDFILINHCLLDFQMRTVADTSPADLIKHSDDLWTEESLTRQILSRVTFLETLP